MVKSSEKPDKKSKKKDKSEKKSSKDKSNKALKEKKKEKKSKRKLSAEVIDAASDTSVQIEKEEVKPAEKPKQVVPMWSHKQLFVSGIPYDTTKD